MSHHLDTPLAAQTGQLYLDDLYVFPGQDSTVFIMDVNSNVNGLHSEPGFHPEARYEFKVHVDGADFEALTYRVSFTEPDSGGQQPLRLHALTGDQAREDAADGELVLEGRTGQAATGGGTRLWSGRIADSFYRAGHPMMWPIFWPNDTDFTNPANTRHPSEDVTAAAKYIGEQIAAVVAAAGTSEDPAGYGQAVARGLFPDVLPYVVGTPAVYGFAGFNGRTRADNAPEAMLSLVTNTAALSGLKPSVAKDQRASTFPYVVPA